MSQRVGGVRLRGMSIALMVTSAIGFTLVEVTVAASGQAQMVPDGTLGTQVGGTCAGTGGTCVISGGSQRGGNLFHSFQQFSLPNGDFAGFILSPDVQNAIVRVTGQGRNFISNINGTIATFNPTNTGVQLSQPVNFFLMNPNGITSGANARLFIGGSFLATTAQRMRFADGTVLDSHDSSNSPLLTVTAPIGLQMGRSPGDIRSGLRIGAGINSLLTDFALVGGSITLDDSIIQTSGEQVELYGIRANGSVSLSVANNNLSFQFPDLSPQADVRVTNDSVIRVTGNGRGTIGIHARNIQLSNSLLNTGIDLGLGGSNIESGGITLNAVENINIDRSTISTRVLLGGQGNNGTIALNARNLTVVNNSQLTTTNFVQGNAGDVIIRAKDSILFDRSNIFTNGRSSIASNSGNIDIQTGFFRLINGSQLTTSTRGKGNAGNVSIHADRTLLDGLNTTIFSHVANDGIGSGGEITIRSRMIQLTNGAQLDASTEGLGKAGDITLQGDTVAFQGVSRTGQSSGAASNVRSGAIGNGGEVRIDARRLLITDGGKLTINTAGRGHAGSLIINADDSVVVEGTDQKGNNSSSLTGQVLPGAVGNGGEITLTTGSLSVRNGALISTTTYGQGNGGNILVQARDTIRFDGTNMQGRSTAAGSQVAQGAIGNGGTFTILAKSLFVTNGAQLGSGTFANGNGGQIIARAGTIRLDGIGRNGAASGIYSNVERGSLGQGGTIDIASDSLSITNGAGIFSNSFSVGRGGDINIRSGLLSLDNRGQISSSTTLSTAGNVNIDVRDLILLRRNSTISTTASASLDDLLFALLLFAIRRTPITIFYGDGGNITINTPNGFLVTAPNENNDITANAFRGKGGRVTVNAQGIYWFTPRSRAELVQLLGTNNPSDLDPQKLPTNDITAISQGSPNLSGTVSLNVLGTDPSKGFLQLPVDLVDAANQLYDECSPSNLGKSSFTYTGRSGIPESPDDPIRETSGLAKWILPPTHLPTHPSTPSSTSLPEPIIEADRLVINPQGTAWLVASGDAWRGVPVRCWHRR